MKSVARLLLIVAALALSFALAPRSGSAGASASATSKSSAVAVSTAPKNCFFVRNHLPCPCPKAQKAETVARAARVTAKALGTAIGTTAVALAKAEHWHEAAAGKR